MKATAIFALSVLSFTASLTASAQQAARKPSPMMVCDYDHQGSGFELSIWRNLSSNDLFSVRIAERDELGRRTVATFMAYQKPDRLERIVFHNINPKPKRTLTLLLEPPRQHLGDWYGQLKFRYDDVSGTEILVCAKPPRE